MSETELIKTAREGDAEQIEKLLTSGADVNAQDDQGWTALNWAAGRGDVEVVERLLAGGADPALTGRDNRTALMIAKAADRAAVIEVLADAEKKAGIWEDPRLTRPYCRAYHLRDLRAFEGWSEERKSWRQDDDEADAEAEFQDDDVVFLHQDFTVTRSMWHGESIIFDAVTDEWRSFCEGQLEFAIPKDLL